LLSRPRLTCFIRACEDAEVDDSDDAIPPLVRRFRALALDANRWLPGAPRDTPRTVLGDVLAELDQLEDPDEWDRYGDRGPVAVVEAKVAELLGKPAAVFFPSGTMAQQSMLRVWCDRNGSRRVAIPELSHLLKHEQDGPRLLHEFAFEQLSEGAQLPTVESLTAIPGRLGAALLELPLRDAGYLLPTWDDLEAFAQACHERAVPLHIDGARLWESTPGLGHDLAACAALADSVYVSFYKGLGAMAGAAVVGPEDELAEVRRWRKRMGGTLIGMTAYALGALRGLRTELPRMAEYHDRAVALAAALAARGVRVFPEAPHTNAFRIFAPSAAELASERLLDLMEQEKTLLSYLWTDTEVPGWSFVEFPVGPATVEWDVDEAADLLARVAAPAEDQLGG
jgi:threonine aldolase